MKGNKRFASIRPDSFTNELPDARRLLEYNMEREAEAERDGAVIDDFGTALRKAPEWLFSLIDDLADRYSVGSPRHFTRALSERLHRPCGDPELSLALADTYHIVRKFANRSVDRDLKDLLKIPSGYYFSPADEYRDNPPMLYVYGWAKDELVRTARITGDESWTVVALSNLCVLLCDFDISPEHRDLLVRHEQRRQTFLKWRYGALLGFVPREEPLWMRSEIERLVRHQPGIKFANIAHRIGFPVDTDATRKKLMRVLSTLRKKGSIRLEKRGYYPK